MKTGYTTSSLVCAAIVDPEGSSIGVIQALNKLAPGSVAPKAGEKYHASAIST